MRGGGSSRRARALRPGAVQGAGCADRTQGGVELESAILRATGRGSRRRHMQEVVPLQLEAQPLVARQPREHALQQRGGGRVGAGEQQPAQHLFLAWLVIKLWWSRQREARVQQMSRRSESVGGGGGAAAAAEPHAAAGIATAASFRWNHASTWEAASCSSTSWSSLSLSFPLAFIWSPRWAVRGQESVDKG